MKIILFVLLTCCSFFIANQTFAEEQIPITAFTVESDPNYFSDDGFGIQILKYFDRPLNPYLIPGRTSDNSSQEDILQYYVESEKYSDPKIIVSDSDRATRFIVDFSNGEIKTKLTFDTFSKFTHLDKKIRGSSPQHYENIQYGLELESLPSEDKKLFYENVIKPSINPGKKPEPFDVDVKIMTGDGSTLQVWKYQKCVINSYTPYLDENLAKNKFVGSFVSEIRDKTTFSCDGFKEDFVLKTPDFSNNLSTLSNKESIADKVLVQFSGGEFPKTSLFSSFSKFTPMSKGTLIPISIPGNVIGEKPRFALESNPTKDKESYYKQIGRYVNPEAKPTPFDVTVHLLTGSNGILQTWKYTDCVATNYFTYLSDNDFIYKFIQKADSEIREKTFFECSGLMFNPELDTSQLQSSVQYASDDSTRAMVFSVDFTGADVSPPKTVNSFTKFTPISYEEMQFLIPNAPFGKEPKFYLESLPSKENQWYYSLMSRYIESGKIPEPIDVTISVITGDDTILQTWKYTKCEVLSYQTYLDDSLFLQKFTQTSYSEFHDRTIFQCVGLAFDGNSYSPETKSEKLLNPVDFIPSTDSRIKNVVTTFSGGDFTEPLKIYTIGKFVPKIEQRSQTSVQLIGLSKTVVSTDESGTTVSGASSLSVRDPPDYCAPGETPPGCKPCPPNNPHCDDSPPVDPGEPPVDPGEPPVDPGEPPVHPEEPGVSDPSYSIVITEPYLYTMQRNDFIKSTEFTITSLPSKDKLQYYELVSRFINPGSKPQPFDVTFDYVSGDGTILQSWKYVDCQITNFNLKSADNLLYFSLSGIQGVSNIVDVSTFQCTGFFVDFNQHKSNFSNNIIPIPSLYDSATLNVVSWYGGESTKERTSSLVQEIESNYDSSLFLSGLPNSQHKQAYDLISRYLNPGKSPEPVDIRIDTVTGDGTVLFSTIHSKCNVDNAAIHYYDGIALVHYTPGLSPEIRGQSVLDCAGTALKISPQKDALFHHTSNLKKISPLIQRSINISSDNVICAEDHQLLIRPPKNVSICVKTEHSSKFLERGWIIPSEQEKKNLTDILGNVLPTTDERAMSFTVIFEGTDISPSQTVSTFSKFVPIADETDVVLRPSIQLDSSSKAFYLESLPSKDKSWYYELASRYVNAGAKPEPFNVTIVVNDGKDDVLLKLKYSNCDIDDFETYYDESLLKYKIHKKWQSEFRDRSIFSCSGLKFN